MSLNLQEHPVPIASVEDFAKRYSQSLFNRALRYTHNFHDAEDAVQQTFLHATRALTDGVIIRHPYSWLHKVLARTVADMKKTKVRRYALENVARKRNTTRLAVQESILDGLIDEENNEKIAEGIRALPEKYGQPLALRLLDGASVDTIAEILESPRVTVGVQIHRGRMLLRNWLFARRCISEREMPAKRQKR